MIKKENAIMKNKSFISLSLLILVSTGLMTSGCAVLLLGGGVAGGYAISRDEIEGFSDKKYNSIWSVGKKIIDEEGLIKSADKDAGLIEAEIQKSVVKFHLDRISSKTNRIRIEARKGYKLLPDIKLAQKLYNELIKELG